MRLTQISRNFLGGPRNRIVESAHDGFRRAHIVGIRTFAQVENCCSLFGIHEHILFLSWSHSQPAHRNNPHSFHIEIINHLDEQPVIRQERERHGKPLWQGAKDLAATVEHQNAAPIFL